MFFPDASFGMWCVCPPCCDTVFSVSGDVCCWWFRSVKSGSFVISFSGSYVLWRFISPCDCDSDERLDCFWSPVVVAEDVVSTVSVVVLLIVVELSELVSELPVEVARRLSWRTLYIIFKSLPSSIISCAIHVRMFRVSCWEKESGSRMSMMMMIILLLFFQKQNLASVI